MYVRCTGRFGAGELMPLANAEISHDLWIPINEPNLQTSIQ